MKIFKFNNGGFPVLFGFIVLPIFSFYIFGGKSSTTKKTTVNNTTVASDNGALSANRSTINITDGGAFQVAGDAFTDVITAFSDTFAGAVSLVDRSADRSNTQAIEALNIAAASKEDDSTEISKIVLIGAGAVAAIAVLPKFFK